MVIVLEENQLEKLVAPCNMIAFEDETQNNFVEPEIPDILKFLQGDLLRCATC